MFKDKTLLVTGGTGSFGNAVVRRFLDHGLREIRIFSRDEKKQEDMPIQSGQLSFQSRFFFEQRAVVRLPAASLLRIIGAFGASPTSKRFL